MFVFSLLYIIKSIQAELPSWGGLIMMYRNGLVDVNAILQMAFANAPSGIAIVDKNEKIIYVNQQYCLFLGLHQNVILGTKLTEHIKTSLMYHVLASGERITKLIQGENLETGVLEEKPIVKKGVIIGGISYIISKNNRGIKMLIDQLSNLEEEVNYYKERLASKETGSNNFKLFISSNDKLIETVELAKRSAKFDANVLITGETGTGKELMALAVHQESGRKKFPFIKVNCAAIPANLLESELFGYEAGAFTGARGDGKPGKFELADNGTIFLDEIGDMPLEMQAKILRVLQEREFERVGGTKTVKVNVRVISATNKDLGHMVKEGTFREDLYYRLLVIGLNLPPLRDRIEDLEYIVNGILNRLCQKYEISKPDISEKAFSVMKKYQWPGNIRELENVLERALNLSTRGLIEINHLPEKMLTQSGVEVKPQLKTLSELIDQREKEIILQTLDYTRNNKQKAAKILGLSRTALYKKINKYNLN